MKKIIMLFVLSAVFLIATLDASAKGRHGSKRVGGHNSHGKGSHYSGGHIHK